jgi:hypothetical protein
MKNKIDPKIVIIAGLVIVLLYCGFRTLSSMAAASGHLTQTDCVQNPGAVEQLLRDLDRTMVIDAESDSSLACPTDRDPFTAAEVGREVKTQASKPVTRTTSVKKMRLTGLILDQNPVAIVEVGGESLEIRVGSLLDGHKVISIDERGVHILKNGNVVIIN